MPFRVPTVESFPASDLLCALSEVARSTSPNTSVYQSVWYISEPPKHQGTRVRETIRYFRWPTTGARKRNNPLALVLARNAYIAGCSPTPVSR